MTVDQRPQMDSPHSSGHVGRQPDIDRYAK